jgi:hypothetical protein
MAKIVGEIVATDWDSNDDPTEICVQTENERYVIEHGESFQELLTYVGCEVEIDGYVEENEEGDSTLAVRDFEVLDTFTEEGEEEEEEEEAEAGEEGEALEYVDEDQEYSKDEDW